MKNMTRSTLSIIVFCGLAAAGCTHAQSTQIPNPLVTGKVSQNAIQFPDRGTEMKFELPAGTLVHEASLVSLDDKEACFHVTLRAQGQKRNLANPKSWRVFLRGSPSFEDMSPEFKDLTPESETVVQGSIEKHATEHQEICDNSGSNCYQKEIVKTSREPAEIKVVTGGGTVCFANKGNIKKGTEEITLHLDDPNPDVSAGAGMGMGALANLQNRVAFRWKFN